MTLLDRLSDWISGTGKELQEAEDRAIRSVAILSATIHVAARNAAAEIRGAKLWTHDDVIIAAKDYEKYIKGD